MNPTLLTDTITAEFTIINYRDTSSPLTVKAAQTALVCFQSYQKSKNKQKEIIIIPTARQNMNIYVNQNKQSVISCQNPDHGLPLRNSVQA